MRPRAIVFAAAAAMLTMVGSASALSGSIATQEWSAGSITIVDGPVTVPAGETLTIYEGAKVQFNADVRFIVEGTLNVWGTEGAMVSFLPGTSAQWGGIRLIGGTSNFMEWVEIAGAVTDTSGGGILVSEMDTYLSISNSIIHDNVASVGAGISVVNLSSADINRCTIVNNTASVWGGGVQNSLAPVTVVESIVWGNAPDQLYQLMGTFNVQYSDVQGGIPAGLVDSVGNINADPMFYDPQMPDVRLTAGSPCIDAGNPESPYDPDGTIADMGAIYYNQSPQGPGSITITSNVFSQPSPPTALALNPQAAAAAVGASNGKVYLWDFEQQTPVLVDSVETNIVMPMPISALEYSPDGMMLVATSWDGRIYAWDDLSVEQWSPEVYAAGIAAMAMSPTGAEVAVASSDGLASTRTTTDGGARFLLEGTQASIVSLVYSATGDTVFGGGTDGAVYAWESATGNLLWRNVIATMPLVDIDVLNDDVTPQSGTWGIAADVDGVVMGWRVEDGMLDGQLPDYYSVGALGIGPGGGQFVLGSAYGAAVANGITIWSSGDQSEPAILGVSEPHNASVRDLKISPSGDVIGTVADDGMLAVYFVDPPLAGPVPEEELRLPDDQYVAFGNQFIVDINGTVLEDTVGIFNLDLVFTFDPAVMSPIDIEAPYDSLVQGTAFDGQGDVQVLANVVDDTVFISIASSTPTTIVNGWIASLAFVASESQGDSWLGWVWDLTNVNERSFMNLWEGWVHVVAPPPAYGDVTDDGNVTALDASWILQQVVRIRSDIDFTRADVSDNGFITGYDAAWVLKYVVDNQVVFPAAANYPYAVKPASENIELAWTPSADGWSLSATGITGLVGADLTLRVPAEATITGGMLAQSRDGDLVTISVASLDGTAELLHVADALVPPEIVSATVNEHEVIAARPVEFSLAQNTPNPFNPTTTIRFSVPEAGIATLAVYDVNGRFVRTLVNDVVAAGAHDIVWNGRDAVGREVASGVYIYRLTTGNRIATHRMTLVR